MRGSQSSLEAPLRALWNCQEHLSRRGGGPREPPAGGPRHPPGPPPGGAPRPPLRGVLGGAGGCWGVLGGGPGGAL